MNRYLAAIIFALLPAGHVIALVGGTEVSSREFSGEFPWMVSVVDRVDGSLCGGVLVSPEWVLTAAHCTNNKRVVMLGNVRNTDARRVEILRAVRHPKFDSSTYEYDVGLLRLSEPVDISPVDLLQETDEPDWLRQRSTAYILGWGRLPNGRLPGSLMSAPVSISSMIIEATYFGVSGSTGPCHRDSGGPLLVSMQEGWLLAGIISVTGGNLCAQGGGVSFYARLTAMQEFILDTVHDLPE